MRRTSLLSTTVGRKFLIALTGLALFAFLLLHLAGNLLVFLGPAAFNNYSHFLISLPVTVPLEIGLALIFILHIYLTVSLWWQARQARPVKYHKKAWARGASRKSVASSTMIYTGSITLLFVLLHLKQFKYGTEYAIAQNGVPMRDLYRLEMVNFHTPWIAALYVVCMAILGFHLWHGFWSATQSLGAEAPDLSRGLLTASKWLAVIVAGGFLIIPLILFLTGATHGVQP
jgi:succinate dehydrogenase / fumarate reductase cytochrome b subunit